MKLTGKMARLHSLVYNYLHGHRGLGSVSMLRPDGSPRAWLAV